MNFLEELIAEWYEYQGYFVRRNVKFDKMPKGGYKGEIDTVAFDPKQRVLKHIEVSGDADSWEKRKTKFRKKFKLKKTITNQCLVLKLKKLRKSRLWVFRAKENLSPKRAEYYSKLSQML